jgi:hypothetical protein
MKGIFSEFLRNPGSSTCTSDLIQLNFILKLPGLTFEMFESYKSAPLKMLHELLYRLSFLELNFAGRSQGRKQRLSWLFLRKCVRWALGNLVNASQWEQAKRERAQVNVCLQIAQ